VEKSRPYECYKRDVVDKKRHRCYPYSIRGTTWHKGARDNH
jgi:hypothetical protein